MIKIRRKCKKIERRKLGIKRSSKARRKFGLRNFAAKRGLLRKSHVAAKKFCSPQESLRKSLFPLRKSLFSAKPFRSRLAPAAKPLFGTRTPVHRAVHPFHSCEMGCEVDAEFPIATKMPSHYEIRDSSLRKSPSAAKRNNDPSCSF